MSREDRPFQASLSGIGEHNPGGPIQGRAIFYLRSQRSGSASGFQTAIPFEAPRPLIYLQADERHVGARANLTCFLPLWFRTKDNTAKIGDVPHVSLFSRGFPDSKQPSKIGKRARRPRISKFVETEILGGSYLYEYNRIFLKEKRHESLHHYGGIANASDRVGLRSGY